MIACYIFPNKNCFNLKTVKLQKSKKGLTTGFLTIFAKLINANLSSVWLSECYKIFAPKADAMRVTAACVQQQITEGVQTKNGQTRNQEPQMGN